MQTNSAIRWVVPLAIAIVTAVMCFRSPYNASDMEVVPDSVEYCAGAYNILAGGQYQIEIENQWYPPRYPPWFSSIFVMPCYVLAPLHLGGPIIMVLIMSILAVLMAYRIGNRISGTGGGLLSAALLLLLPVFRTSAMNIMTDIPCTALCLAAASLYLEFNKESTISKWLVAGLVCALSASLRPLTVFLCVPFILIAIKHRSAHSFKKWGALLAPSIIMGCLTLFYNHRTFGSALRNGYHYWCAVPYDYFSLTFGIRNISVNAAHLLLGSAFIIPIFLLFFLLWAKCGDSHTNADHARDPAHRFLFFCVVSMTPLTVLHLLYFFQEQRFFLPMLAFSCAFTGAIGGVFFRLESARRTLLTLSLLVAACTVIWIRTPPHIPHRRHAAERIDQYVPDKATVISAIDPAYLALVLRHRTIYFLPVSRTVEYASKAIVPIKIKHLDPAPQGSSDHRAAALMARGAEDSIRWTADEILSAVIAMSQSGREYYVDTGGITPKEMAAMQKVFESCRVQEITPRLYRLGPPSAPLSAQED